MVFNRLTFVALLAAGLAGPIAGSADVSLPARNGPVILTVTGLDTAKYPGGTLEFDVAMLQAMGAVKITTSTIWTDGRHSFTGVPLKTLATDLGIGDRTLRYHALNDYAIEFPVRESDDVAPILAFEMDDAPMSVRDKGPMWVIYPYDDALQYRTETIYSRSIWQLDRIDVLP